MLGCLLCGCGQQAAFNDLKEFLGNTKPDGSLDAEIFAKHWFPVVDRKDYGVPFLLEQCRSRDRQTAITAYIALEGLVEEVWHNGTPRGDSLVREIRPEGLVASFASFQTNGMAPPWTEWYGMANELMREYLEPKPDGDNIKPAP